MIVFVLILPSTAQTSSQAKLEGWVSLHYFCGFFRLFSSTKKEMNQNDFENKLENRF